MEAAMAQFKAIPVYVCMYGWGE